MAAEGAAESGASELSYYLSHMAQQAMAAAMQKAARDAPGAIAKGLKGLFKGQASKRQANRLIERKKRSYQKKAKTTKNSPGMFSNGGIFGKRISHLTSDPSIKSGRVIKKSGFGKRKRKRGRKKRQTFSKRVARIAENQIQSHSRNKHKFKNTAITWGQIGHGVNVCAYDYVMNASLSNIDAAWSNVDIVEAIGTGYSTVNMSSIPGVTLHNINFYDVRIYRNNQSMPCYFEVWECTAKRGNTSALTPVEAIKEGLDDLNLNTGLGGANEPTTTDQLFEISPLKSKVFRAQWKVDNHKLVLLQPGDEVVVSLVRRNFDYVPEEADAVTAEGGTNIEYMPGVTQCAVIRTYGVISHDDTTETIVGRSSGELDYEARQGYTLGTADMGKMLRYDGNSTVYQAIVDPVAKEYGHTGEIRHTDGD